MTSDMASMSSANSDVPLSLRKTFAGRMLNMTACSAVRPRWGIASTTCSTFAVVVVVDVVVVVGGHAKTMEFSVKISQGLRAKRKRYASKSFEVRKRRRGECGSNVEIYYAHSCATIC